MHLNIFVVYSQLLNLFSETHLQFPANWGWMLLLVTYILVIIEVLLLSIYTINQNVYSLNEGIIRRDEIWNSLILNIKFAS